VQNADLARLFSEIADLLEIKGENPFRVRAYRRAAEGLEGLTEDVGAVAARDGLEELQGIGKDLAGKIREALATGSIEYLEDLRQQIPAGVVDLMGIQGVGPRTAQMLFQRAGVDSVEKLEALAGAGKLAGLPGIKARTEQNILKGIAVWKAGRERMPLGRALALAVLSPRIRNYVITCMMTTFQSRSVMRLKIESRVIPALLTRMSTWPTTERTL